MWECCTVKFNKTFAEIRLFRGFRYLLANSASVCWNSYNSHFARFPPTFFIHSRQLIVHSFKENIHSRPEASLKSCQLEVGDRRAPKTSGRIYLSLKNIHKVFFFGQIPCRWVCRFSAKKNTLELRLSMSFDFVALDFFIFRFPPSGKKFLSDGNFGSRCHCWTL